MELTPEQAAAAVERHPCPKCDVPAGSPCRTRAGKVAAKYHTARFILVPALREDLAVAAPPDRGPGTSWKPGPPVEVAATPPVGAPIRIGYARCSTAQQDLQIQLDALERAHCTRIFSEKISSRIKIRPEFDKALALARDITQAAPGQPVILTVHELKRPARNAAELMAVAAALVMWLGTVGGYAVAGIVFLVPPLVWAIVIHVSKPKKPQPPASDLSRVLLAAVAKETPWIAIIGAGIAGAANMFLNRNRAPK